MSTSGEKAGIINGVAIVINELVHKLEQQNLISKGDLAKALRDATAGIPQVENGEIRMDVLIVQAVADLLDRPPPKPWSPSVIPGGRSGVPDDGNSDP